MTPVLRIRATRRTVFHSCCRYFYEHTHRQVCLQHKILSSGPERNTELGGFPLLLLHLDRRVGLSRADDALPLSIATSSRSTTAGPQRESGSLLGHTTAVTVSSEPLEGAKTRAKIRASPSSPAGSSCM